jgi:hypothetical protein
MIQDRWINLARKRSALPRGVVHDVLEMEKPSSSLRSDGKGGWIYTTDGGPQVMLTDVVRYKTDDGQKKEISQTSLFTWTSKMTCASFSLPAGPPKYGGTCMASAEKFGCDYKEVVCYDCYATRNRYLFSSNAIRQAVKLQWVKTAMRRGSFVDEMVEAIRFISQSSVAQYLRGRDIEANYFRIHDSGDWIDENYFRAWIEICRKLSGIRFWVPTRMWIFEDWADLFKGTRLPKNMTMRPSTLCKEEVPFLAKGLSGAGASVSHGELPDPVYNCPATFGDDSDTCLGSRGPDGKTGCRACWDWPSLLVNYKRH